MALFGLSNDSVQVLSDFTTDFGITYNLLSDEGSATIQRLGLLNHHIVEQQAYYGFGEHKRYDGLPYPGSIVLDADGIVRKRLFDQSYRERPSPGVLLRAASGHAPAPDPERSATVETPVVKVGAWFEASTFRPMERVELTVTLHIADGWHVYVGPIADGLTALDVKLGPEERLRQSPAQIPPGHPFSVAGLEGTSNVVDGNVEITVPVLLQGAGFLADGSKRSEPQEPGPMNVKVEISFQACSATECRPPESHVFRFTMEEEGQFFPG